MSGGFGKLTIGEKMVEQEANEDFTVTRNMSVADTKRLTARKPIPNPYLDVEDVDENLAGGIINFSVPLLTSVSNEGPRQSKDN